MPAHPDQSAADFFRTFTDPTRLTILRALAAGPKSRTELVEIAESTQGNIDPHLVKLRQAGLVTRTRQAQAMIYRLVGGRATKAGVVFTHVSGAKAVVPWAGTDRPPT